MTLTSIELLGFVAGLFGTFAAAPQAYKIIQTRQARDVSLTTYLMAMTGGVLWGLYGWLEGAFSIVFWNAVSLMMCSAIIWLKLHHSGSQAEAKVDPALPDWQREVMPRYKLLIEYHGGPYQGWMRLPGIATVQGALEEAAAKIEGAPVEVIGAGRTDSGVHATGQVAHLDLSLERPEKIADALNFHLRPHPIAVLKADIVDGTFHARFSAAARHYRYIVINRRADLTLERGLAWRVPSKLDAAAMHAAAQQLLGNHDFTTFRDTGCQAASPVKTLDRLDVARFGDRIEITCSAQSFLHRQVRSMVGSLVEVGRGFQRPEWIGEILAAADRTACGPVAPGDGLFLERVDYPAAP